MIQHHDEEYIGLVKYVLDEGIQKTDRTGTGTISLPFQQMRFDLSGGSIPLLTTKKMHTRSIIYEILWYLRGDTNIKYLNDNGVKIWNEWADERGDLGPVYGHQWRDWGGHDNYYVDPITFETEQRGHTIGIDQIARVINQLKNNPDDRGIIVSAWNVAEIDDMALRPCHSLFQFWSAELPAKDREEWMYKNVNCVTCDGPISDEAIHEKCDRHNVPRRQLRCHLYQRSADVGLGVPFNIVQYSILTHMIAKVTNHIATEFVWTGGDVHIYNNHIEQLNEQIERTYFPSPTIKFDRDIESIDDLAYEDFVIEGYDCHPIIKMPVAV